MQLFGGVSFMLYTVLKNLVDPILQKYMPPSPMAVALASVAAEGINVVGIDALGSLGLATEAHPGLLNSDGSA